MCLSDQVTYYQGHYTQRFYCSQHDFDMCLKCALQWAFVPFEGITLEESRTAFFVLQAPISGAYNRDRDIFINRFWRREDAFDYMHRLQRVLIYPDYSRSGQMNEHARHAFGLVVQNSKILAHFGFNHNIKEALERIRDDDFMQRYQRLVWNQFGEVEVHRTDVYQTFCVLETFKEHTLTFTYASAEEQFEHFKKLVSYRTSRFIVELRRGRIHCLKYLNQVDGEEDATLREKKMLDVKYLRQIKSQMAPSYLSSITEVASASEKPAEKEGQPGTEIGSSSGVKEPDSSSPMGNQDEKTGGTTKADTVRDYWVQWCNYETVEGSETTCVTLRCSQPNLDCAKFFAKDLQKFKEAKVKIG